MDDMTDFDPSNCTLPDIRKTAIYQDKDLLLLYLISFVIISVMILFGNGIVLWAFATNKKLRTRKYILIFSLCITDVTTGCLMPIQIFGRPSVVDGMSVALLQISIFTNLAIAVERFYILVVRAKTPGGGATSKQLIIFCVLMWICTISFILPFTAYPYYYILLLYTFAPFSVIVAMISLICLYIAIFYSMRKMDKKRQKKLGGKGDFKRTHLVVRAYAVIVVVFGVCWLPWCFEAIRICVEYYFASRHCFFASKLACFFLNFGLMNSALNPFIYWRKLPDFHHAISNLPLISFLRRKCSMTKTESNTMRSNTDGVAAYDGPTVELE